MDRKDTLVSTEDDKDREELHIRNALKRKKDNRYKIKIKKKTSQHRRVKD